MIFIEESNIKSLAIGWFEAIQIMKDVIACLLRNDYSQPIKPYLRFKDTANRIIAMPASLGSPFDIAGIKWIASFPENILNAMPRAHSLTILNSVSTGKPIAVIESSLLSGIRTVAVSALIIDNFTKAFPKRKLKVGISGFGFIGKLHLKMLQDLIPNQLLEVFVFDNQLDCIESSSPEFTLRCASNWNQAYDNSDLFIACTTTSLPYIKSPPKKGSLHLNVSLRDYHSKIIRDCPHLIVDSWEEVCREGTGIERAHLELKLRKENTLNIADIISSNYFSKLDKEKFLMKEYAIFNPMGMAVFDVALAKYVYDKLSASEEHLSLRRDFHDV